MCEIRSFTASQRRKAEEKGLRVVEGTKMTEEWEDVGVRRGDEMLAEEGLLLLFAKSEEEEGARNRSAIRRERDGERKMGRDTNKG